MMRLLTRLVCMIALALTGCERAAEPPSESAQMWPAFEKEKAWDDLQNLIDFSPRAHGTPGHRFTVNYLTSRLRANGLTPSVISFTNRTSAGLFTFHNIEAVLPGSTRDIILVTTHFDARYDGGPDFTSANSSGSGPATLLEIARILAAHHTGRGPEIRFVFFDGMEPMVRHGFSDGLQGSRFYLRQLDEQKRLSHVIAQINLDLVGDRDLTITLARNLSMPLRKQLLDAAHRENARQYFRLVPVEIGDDHDPFHQRGVPAINLIDFEYGSAPGRNDYWRTPEDTIDKLSPDSLDVIGRVTLRLIRDLVAAR